MSCTRSKAGFRRSIERMGEVINHLPCVLVCTPRLVLSGAHSSTICCTRTILGPSLFLWRGREARARSFNQQPQGGAVFRGAALPQFGAEWTPKQLLQEIGRA